MRNLHEGLGLTTRRLSRRVVRTGCFAVRASRGMVGQPRCNSCLCNRPSISLRRHRLLPWVAVWFMSWQASSRHTLRVASRSFHASGAQGVNSMGQPMAEPCCPLQQRSGHVRSASCAPLQAPLHERQVCSTPQRPVAAARQHRSWCIHSYATSGHTHSIYMTAALRASKACCLHPLATCGTSTGCPPQVPWLLP